MLRKLEIAWLVFAIIGALFTVFKMVTGGISEGLFTVFFTLIALVFYFIRRKQRIAMEKEEDGVNDASIRS